MKCDGWSRPLSQAQHKWRQPLEDIQAGACVISFYTLNRSGTSYPLALLPGSSHLQFDAD